MNRASFVRTINFVNATAGQLLVGACSYVNVSTAMNGTDGDFCGTSTRRSTDITWTYGRPGMNRSVSFDFSYFLSERLASLHATYSK
jgi:hypothetical protein